MPDFSSGFPPSGIVLAGAVWRRRFPVLPKRFGSKTFWEEKNPQRRGS